MIRCLENALDSDLIVDALKLDKPQSTIIEEVKKYLAASSAPETGLTSIGLC